MLEDHDKIKILEQSFNKLSEKKKSSEIYYSDQIYDAYADKTILDNEIVYHCGASINRIGHKTFSINILEDEKITKTLINKIKTIKRNKWQTSKEVIK